MMKKIEEFLDRPITIAHFIAGVIGLFVVLFFNTAEAAEFRGGDSYVVTRLSGTARVTCSYYENGRHQTRHATIRCEGESAYPGTHSRFTHENSRATQVRITNRSYNNRTKNKKFYPKKGESKLFNLFTRSLFQRPLLKLGANNLDYSLFLKDGSIEEAGSFDVYVDFRRKSCRSGYIHSSNSSDCMGQSVCNRYFRSVRCR